jgi:hypothetical protein
MVRNSNTNDPERPINSTLRRSFLTSLSSFPELDGLRPHLFKPYEINLQKTINVKIENGKTKIKPVILSAL